MKKLIYLCLIFLEGYFSGGCQTNSFSVEQVWARPGLAGGNSAVYLRIDNPTHQDEVLLEARSDISEYVEIHKSVMKDNRTMSMEMQESVPIPAGGEVEFKPGGLHIMLINLKSDLQSGEQFPLILTFTRAGEISLTVEVSEP